MIQQLHMNGTQNGKKANGEFQIMSRGLGLAAGMVVCSITALALSRRICSIKVR